MGCRHRRPVNALCVFNGDLIAGGQFTVAGGALSNRIARWDGTEWSSLSGPSGTGIGDTVNVFGVYDDWLVAGGRFTEAGGISSWRIAFYGALAFSVGGTVQGLEGSGLMLQLNGSNHLSVSENGDFAFANTLDDDAAFEVTVAVQPTNPEQICTVANGSGTVSGSDVSDAAVNCSFDDLFSDRFEQPAP